jgi:hypothetical protein
VRAARAWEEMRKHECTTSHTASSESAPPLGHCTHATSSCRMHMSTTSSAAGSVTSKRQKVAACTTETMAVGSRAGSSVSRPALRKERTAHSARCVTTPLVSSMRMVSRKGSR